MPPTPTFTLYDQPSRPQSPSFHINAVVDLHAALYGAAGRDRAAISALVWDLYDTNAGELDLLFGLRERKLTLVGPQSLRTQFRW